MKQPTKEEIKKRTIEIIDEKYNWLETRQKECKESGECFDVKIEVEAWLSMKLAEHEVIINKMINQLK